MSAKQQIYCGNNEFSPVLQRNGGTRRFGTHAECFKKGYAVGSYQKISDVTKFLPKWTGKYRPFITQKLYYSDEMAVPNGYQRATFAQRGFALGSIARAKRLPAAKPSPHLAR